MSNIYRKIKYVVEANYGMTEERTLYVHHNNSIDYVTFYDEDGTRLFGYGEWGIGKQLDLGQAIAKMLTSTEQQESCTPEEIAFIKSNS